MNKWTNTEGTNWLDYPDSALTWRFVGRQHPHFPHAVFQPMIALVVNDNFSWSIEIDGDTKFTGQSCSDVEEAKLQCELKLGEFLVETLSQLDRRE